ncbi:SDR family oxidoreductase [Pelagicoccus sp. SDUM812002]|uniref:SDR family oxidoreductase n=1 Tax=Pelagicoccus sp. SDUM812002 TaxID=3041266 RepID=UPI00280C6704|nr:SDR family oxidoreductase [Pelagicoccus sp. SDUM812002]MDQ8184054.1 SDR family oxidoreductase [Pelagicoccus sp. SDUM812002]
MATILVTGASRGIGLELACQYAEAGDAVIATCRDTDTAKALIHLSESYENVEVQTLDVVDPLSILSLASMLSKRGDKLDALYSNAGIAVAEKVGEWSADSFSATLETNVVGPAMIMQAFIKVMAPGGKIINVSSRMGSFDFDINLGGELSSYAASKSALNMVVRQVAPSLRDRGVIALAVSPGWVKTDMGGHEATLTPEESVRTMIETVAKLTLEDAGSFIEYTGEEIPW